MFDKSLSQVTAIIGSQWGDEGKGKLVDILSKEFDIILRATGGANAGHTIYAPNPINPDETVKFVFHLAPSGIIHEGKVAVLGNGLAMHLPSLIEELDVLEKYKIDPTGRFFISDRAHIVFDYHKKIDALEEELKGKKKVGTTLRGIGPAYQDKIARRGVRVGELLDFDKFADHVRNTFSQLKRLHKDLDHDIEAELEQIKGLLGIINPFITDAAVYINDALKSGKTILIEGANGVLLDIDHGTYPFVTSSNPTAGGFHTGTGIGINKIQSLIGIVKSYMTRVGSGPFPTELFDATGDKLRDFGGEFGSTTGRPRRCGWFDAVATKYAVIINGLTSINLTKLDILDKFETIKVCTKYTYKGKDITSIPASAEMLDECEPHYIEIEGWNCDTSETKTFDKLPQKAKDYIKKLEELIECPVNFIGVGVRRDQIIYKEN
jgi:adenylosuccinate synthase